MKNSIIVLLGCLLTLNVALAVEPSSANQKWLTAVEQMVADGHTTISTPSKERADLLKEWARKQGFSVEVTKIDQGYRAEVSKRLVRR